MVRHPETFKHLQDTVDFNKRKGLYCEMQKIISDDGGVIVPCFDKFLDGRSARVRGVESNPLGPMGAYRFSEKAWLA